MVLRFNTEHLEHRFKGCNSYATSPARSKICIFSKIYIHIFYCITIMADKYDFIIIGCGIAGLYSAYKIRKNSPTATILVLERNDLERAGAIRHVGVGELPAVINSVVPVGSRRSL